MRTRLLFVLLALTLCLGVKAQISNRALQFSSSGYVDCGYMPSLEGLSSYSIQFWVNPSEWLSGGNLVSYSDDFNVKLGQPGEIIISSGENSIEVKSEELKPEIWSQVTIINKDGNAEILINGEKVSEGNLSSIHTSGSDASFKIGGNFRGMIDEVRIWNDALNEEMQTYGYFINNTINKWNPMWSNLVAYYKMDQPDCNALVEFKAIEDPQGEFNNHGILNGNVKRVEANNQMLPYLVNAAYTENPRFYQTVIPKDQYLLHNELIILGTDVYGEDGRIETKTPNNHALAFYGTSFLPEFENRSGILVLQGNKDSYFNIPENSLDSNNYFTLETWLYLDKYSPEGILLRRTGNEKEEDLEVFFGKDPQKPSLNMIVGNKEFEAAGFEIPLHKWFHLALTTEEEGNTLKSLVYLNGEKYEFTDKGNIESSVFDKDRKAGIFIGEKLNGKIDEIVIWNKGFSATEIGEHFADGIPSPGYGYPVKREDMNAVGAYYKFDREDALGHSYHSQDEWLNIMKKNYEGRQGIKYYISVQGTYKIRDKYGDWRQILESPEKRSRFAQDLAEISKNYDGAELDLEWIEQPELWHLYGLLAQEIREAMPEDKEFRISLHNNFTAFPEDKMKYVDCFTFQQYGPQPSNFSYQIFKDNVRKFEKKYDKDKIMTSYSTTTSRGSEGSPVRLIKGEPLDKYVPNEEDSDSLTIGDETWKFMGPMQVYKRAEYTREQNLRGIFYWVLSDDNWDNIDGQIVLSPNNQARYASYGINANTDPIIESVVVNHP